MRGREGGSTERRKEGSEEGRKEEGRKEGGNGVDDTEDQREEGGVCVRGYKCDRVETAALGKGSLSLSPRSQQLSLLGCL